MYIHIYTHVYVYICMRVCVLTHAYSLACFNISREGYPGNLYDPPSSIHNPRLSSTVLLFVITVPCPLRSSSLCVLFNGQNPLRSVGRETENSNSKSGQQSWNSFGYFNEFDAFNAVQNINVYCMTTMDQLAWKRK